MEEEKYFISAKEVRGEIIRILESTGWTESIYNEDGEREIRCFSRGDLEVECYPESIRVTVSREGLFLTSAASYQYVEVTGSRIRGRNFNLEVTTGND